MPVGMWTQRNAAWRLADRQECRGRGCMVYKLIECRPPGALACQRDSSGNVGFNLTGACCVFRHALAAAFVCGTLLACCSAGRRPVGVVPGCLVTVARTAPPLCRVQQYGRAHLGEQQCWLQPARWGEPRGFAVERGPCRQGQARSSMHARTKRTTHATSKTLPPCLQVPPTLAAIWWAPGRWA